MDLIPLSLHKSDFTSLHLFREKTPGATKIVDTCNSISGFLVLFRPSRLGEDLQDSLCHLHSGLRHLFLTFTLFWLGGLCHLCCVFWAASTASFDSPAEHLSKFSPAFTFLPGFELWKQSVVGFHRQPNYFWEMPSLLAPSGALIAIPTY